MPGSAGDTEGARDRVSSVSTNDLKNGMTLDLDGTLYTIVEFQHVKPGKGGAFVRTKLRNARTGAVVERTFNAGVKVGLAIVDKREMQYLYRDGEDLVFMDTGSYDQHHVPAVAAGDMIGYLADGQTATIAMFESEVISIELPAAVVLDVVKADPGVKGDRVSGALKPITLSTGIVVQAPLFVEAGERVKVDTRSGEYLERLK
ncbi:MAG: elongation factor P [Actinomycetota bacterium]